MSALLSLVPWYIRILLTVCLALSAVVFGYVKGEEHEQYLRLSADQAAVHQGDAAVVRYVDRVVTVTRNAPNVLPNLERLCRGFVQGGGSPDAAAGTDAGAGPTLAESELELIAAEVPRCQRNAAKLQAIQDALRPQLH